MRFYSRRIGDQETNRKSRPATPQLYDARPQLYSPRSQLYSETLVGHALHAPHARQWARQKKAHQRGGDLIQNPRGSGTVRKKAHGLGEMVNVWANVLSQAPIVLYHAPIVLCHAPIVLRQAPIALCQDPSCTHCATPGPTCAPTHLLGTVLDGGFGITCQNAPLPGARARGLAAPLRGGRGVWS